MIEYIPRDKRGMAFATFYAKFDEITSSTARPLNVDSLDLDNIGGGYDTWTRSETQLLVLAVVLIIITLVFAILVTLDCGRNQEHRFLRVGTLRDLVQMRTRRELRGHQNIAMDDLKAPPVSFLAPPPYSSPHHRQQSWA